MIYDTDLKVGDEITDVSNWEYKVVRVSVKEITYSISSPLGGEPLSPMNRTDAPLDWIAKLVRNDQTLYSTYPMFEVDKISDQRPF